MSNNQLVLYQIIHLIENIEAWIESLIWPCHQMKVNRLKPTVHSWDSITVLYSVPVSERSRSRSRSVETEVCCSSGRWVRRRDQAGPGGVLLTGQLQSSVQSSPEQASLSDRDMLVFTLLLSSLVRAGLANWNEWWTYDGISGPAYWGLINPAWTMCNKVSFTILYL